MTWKNPDGHTFRMPFLAVLLLSIAAFGIDAIEARAGTPPGTPPPYTDVSTAQKNAQTGIGRTQGWKVAAATGAGNAINIMAQTSMPATTFTDLSPNISLVRWVTIQRVSDDATAGLAVCARLGPDTDVPQLNCVSTSTTTGDTGGCYLTSANPSCTILLRPITTQCHGYTECSQPIWISESSDHSAIVAVNVSW